MRLQTSAYYLFLGLLLNSPHLSNSATSYIQPTLTLKQAVPLAFESRSSIRERYYGIRSKRDLALAAFSGYLPQVSVETNLQNNKNDIFPHNQTAINFSQLLFSLSGPFQQYNIANQNTQAAEYSYELEMDTVQFEVESNYLTYWLTLQKYGAIKARFFATRDTFARDIEAYRVGLQSEPIWAQSKAFYAQNMATVRSYQDEVARNKASLERALETQIGNIDAQALQCYINVKIESARHYQLPVYLEQALIHRKELGIINAAIEREKQLARFYRQSYIPTVSFFSVVSDGRVASLATPKAGLFWQFGLNFTWNFDGLANIHQSNASSSDVVAQQAALESTKQNIIKEVKTSYHDLQELVKRRDAQVTELAYQEKEYLKKEMQYRVGMISLPAFQDAKQQWQEAQFAFHEIEATTAIKQRELEFACGYPQS